MNRIKMLKYINLVIAVLISSQLLSGIFNSMIADETYEVIHGGGGLLLFTGVIIHVVLNWGWVKSTYFKK